MTLSVSLTHRFEGFTLDASFDAPDGITALFGRSGSGKTTIINAIAGLIDVDQGRISVGDRVLLDRATGRDMPTHKRRMGYVFQDARLFPHLSVSANLGFGARFSGGRPARAQMDQVVELLGLGPLLARRPADLSGGEKQRVAIGRALLSAPDMILADEPLASLDAPRKAEILPYFERLRDETGIPILYVSHSVSEVARLATTVVALRDGRVIGRGPAHEILGDSSIMPTGVRDAGAVLSARVVAHHDDGLTELDAGGTALFLPDAGHDVGAKIRVRIAAQDVILARKNPEDISALNVLRGTVASVRMGSGPGAIVTLETPAGRILARVTRRSVARLAIVEGTALYAIVKTVSVAPADVSPRV